MTERQKERLMWGGAVVVVVLVLLWLWKRAHAGASQTGVVGPPGTAGASNAPVTYTPNPGGPNTPTVLGLPAPQISLSFENPFGAFTNQATGYVPLYGFLGYAGNY